MARELINKPEDKLQTSICNYIALQYPKVVFFSIPNGLDITSSYVRFIAKVTGKKAGVPDLFIAQPKFLVQGDFEEFKYAGLFIEVKTAEHKYLNIKKGVVSDDQILMIDRLNKSGYLAVVCWGFDEAKIIIDAYLKK